MQKGSALFYHGHIKNSIQKVDTRTEGYIRRRKQFLRKYCEPLDQKILKLDKEIDFYNHLIENQNEMIENEQQVAGLKLQINEFLATQKYFLSHLEQYQERIVELTLQNKLIQGKIRRIKEDITGITKRKSEQVYREMSERDNRSMRSGNLNNSKISHLEHGMSNSKNHPQALLPAIFKVEKYFVNKETEKIRDNANTNKNANSKTTNSNMQNSTVGNIKTQQPNPKQKSKVTHLPIANLSQLQKQLTLDRTVIERREQQLRLKFKEIVTVFNKFQSLLKECFDKKKAQVQKSVSQLQSKLISNRERFLEICSAVADKDIRRIPFESFESLSGDQIMTLMISFPWIQKKIFKELVQKRKTIVQLQASKFI